MIRAMVCNVGDCPIWGYRPCWDPSFPCCQWFLVGTGKRTWASARFCPLHQPEQIGRETLRNCSKNNTANCIRLQFPTILCWHPAEAEHVMRTRFTAQNPACKSRYCMKSLIVATSANSGKASFKSWRSSANASKMAIVESSGVVGQHLLWENCSTSLGYEITSAFNVFSPWMCNSLCFRSQLFLS